MSEENETPEEGMSSTQKMIFAVAGVFVAGFIAVGTTKVDNKSAEQLAGEAEIATVVSMMTIGTKKCPLEIKRHTQEQVYNHSRTDTDKATYLTLIWDAGDTKNFKTASCTISLEYGGMSKLVIDDKVVVDRSLD